jgi:Protein of unknown function (DUF1571)
MNEAKDCNRRVTNRLPAFLGFCFCSALAGCSGFGGLQSVGAWPPLAHLWERPPASPAPENDGYAQAMRPNVEMNLKLADAAKQNAARSRDDGLTKPTEPDSSSRAIAGADDAAPGAKRGDGRQGVQVTLGRPEPLPGLSPASDSESSRLASAGTPTWRAAGDEPDEGDAPALAAPAPALVADDSLPEDVRPGPALEPAGQGPEAPAAEHAPAHLALANQSQPDPAADSLAPGETADPPARDDAKIILAQAVAKLQGLDAYQVKMQRRERVGGSVLPEEEVLLSIRRKPKAVRLEWVTGSSKGREVIFAPALDAKMIYVHQPSTAVVMPSMKIAVDSPLVMKNSRHTIAEAGFDTILANLQKSKRDADSAGAGGASLEYKGIEKAAGVDRACHHFIRHTASGETWDVYLDPRSLLPRLVLAENQQGDLLERYVYSEIRENPKELASAAAFSPSERWGEGKGFFSRLAKAASGSSVPGNNAPATR